MPRRPQKRITKRGAPTKVLDEDTLEGWPPFTVFVTCNNRGELYHRAKRQSANILAVTMETLCGAKAYQGASMRRSWDGIEVVSVCTDCRDKAIEF